MPSWRRKRLDCGTRRDTNIKTASNPFRPTNAPGPVDAPPKGKSACLGVFDIVFLFTELPATPCPFPPRQELHSPFHCIVYLRVTRTQISLSKAPVDRREELSPLPSFYLDGCIYNDHCSLAGDVVSDGERPSTPTARSSTQACAKARRELTATSDLSTREPSVTACMRPCAVTPRTRNCRGSIGNEKAKRTQ